MASLPRPQEGNPLTPAPRIKDPERLRAVWRDLFEADRFANEDRATITDEFSGGLPWEPQELENSGNGQMANINWGIGEAQMRAYVSTFVSLTRSAEKIAKVYLKPELNISYSNRVKYQSVLADEFHKLNTKSPYWRSKFFWRLFRLSREYGYFGVAFAFFESLKDWRFQTAGFNKVKIQRAAEYDGPDSTEVAFMKREYTAAEFVAPLRNGEKSATRAGWNVPALKAATLRLMERYGFRQDLETFIHEIKNNDLYYRSGRAETIPVLHSFVQEFNGKYSWYILTEEAVNALKETDENGYEFEPWLFKKEFVFPDAADCVIPFVAEVGTGEIHSVRGQGHRLFEIDVQRNRMTCMLLDNCIQSGGNMWQAGSENAMEDFDIFKIGNNFIAPPGFTFVDKSIQNLSPNLELGLKTLADVQDNAAGVFTARQAGDGGGTSQDASDTRATTDENIVLNEADRMNWMESLALVYNAQWRRIVKAAADDPGGLLATDMVKRCVARGVPIEIVTEGVEFLEPWLGIFVPGTSKSQEDQLEMATKVAGALPIEGRDQIQRALTIAIAGPQNVDSLDPQTPTGPNIEAQMAMLENGFLSEGKAWPVQRNQDHLAHAIQHEAILDPVAQAAVQAIQSGNVQATGPAMQAYGVLVQHTGAHIAALAAMPTPPPEFPKLQEVFKANQRSFKQLTRVANANAQRAQKALQKQQQNGQNGGGPAGTSQPTPDELAVLTRAQTEREIALEDAAQERNLKDLKTQNQIDNQNIKVAQKAQATDLLTSQKLTGELQKQRLTAKKAAQNPE